MNLQSLVIAGSVVASFFVFGRAAIADSSGVMISGPHVHENLAVYFIHGPSAEGPVPLTLAEALEKGSVKISETGEVNELKIENTGSEAVFIQAGDIVKGGRQDRTLTMSLIVPPHSGEVPLASFCVEHGRWSGRGGEDSATFASAAEAVPSREAKLAMRAPMPAAASGAAGLGAGDLIYERQGRVWDSVAKMQRKFSESINADVASPVSATSLQLALENEKLNELRSAYVKALEMAGASETDIIGYAFAVNGKLNSADIYASHGLFRKMWPKQLQAAATEAIGERGGAAKANPSTGDVKAFLDEAKRGPAKETALNDQNRLETRESDNAVYFAAAPASGSFIHENYLAK